MECTTENGRSVRLFVAPAAGSEADTLLKYPLNGHPLAQRSLYWQGPLPFKPFVRFAVRDIITCLLAYDDSTTFFKCFSAQFISIGGKNSPSGKCGMPSRLPLIPTN